MSGENNRVGVRTGDLYLGRRGKHFAFNRRQIDSLQRTCVVPTRAGTARSCLAGADLALHKNVGCPLELELLHRDAVQVGDAAWNGFILRGEGVVRAVVEQRLQLSSSVEPGFRVGRVTIRDGDPVPGKLRRNLKVEPRY